MDTKHQNTKKKGQNIHKNKLNPIDDTQNTHLTNENQHRTHEIPQANLESLHGRIFYFL